MTGRLSFWKKFSTHIYCQRWSGKSFMQIWCSEVPKPSYPPYFDQLIERYQPLWENVLNNNFYWWDFHTQEGKVRISVRVVCISLRGSEHQEQQTGQPITINKQQTTPRTNTGSPGKCKRQARPLTLILTLFWSLHGCQVRANFNEQVWTKLANIQQWICNHLNMKACGGYIMVSHSYVFCFIKWIIYIFILEIAKTLQIKALRPNTWVNAQRPTKAQPSWIPF